jgi:serine protease Do
MSVAEQLRDQTQRVVEATASALVRIGQHGGRGAGVVVDRGIVVTNAHNLRDRTTEVTFGDGRAVQGRALGVDLDGDLAVIEVDTGEAQPLAWADGSDSDSSSGSGGSGSGSGSGGSGGSDSGGSDTSTPSAHGVALGTPVFAPVRVADGTIRVTVGTVSGVDRAFRGPRGRRIPDGIEHTAPLARGSSGSPIVDEHGRLLGISTLRLGDGFTLALPADAEMWGRIAELRSGQAPQRHRLGVGLAPAQVTRRLRRAVGLPDRDGVLVRMVEHGSAAERAGIQRGDLITAVADTPVSSPDDVATALDQLPTGSSLVVHVVRGTEELDIAVTFAEPEPGAGSTPPEHGQA